MILFIFTPCLLPAKSIRVAAITDMTGPNRSVQKPLLQTIEFGVNRINQKSVETGLSINLVKLDSKGTVIGARMAAKEAVDRKSSAVIGPLRSSAALAAASVLQKAGVVMITPTATNPSVTLQGSYIFRTCYTDTFQGKVLAEFAVSSLNAFTAAVLINAENRYSTGLAESFIKNFSSLGGTIVYQADYLEKVTDLEKMVMKVRPEKPDVIFIPGYSRDAGAIIKKIRKQGLTSFLLGGDGWGTASIGKYAKDAVNGAFRTGFWHPELPGSKSRSFVKEFRNIHGNIKRQDIAGAYEAVLLLARAARNAESDNPADIRDSLNQIHNFEGLTGRMRFNKNGDPLKSIVILKYEKRQPMFYKTIAHETLLKK